MNDTYQPHKPEKTITATITAREAHLLHELKAICFGEIKVFKANNVIIRVESSNSVLIKEDEGEKYARVK